MKTLPFSHFVIVDYKICNNGLFPIKIAVDVYNRNIITRELVEKFPMYSTARIINAINHL